ncbi:MAG: hypothetical protein KME16_03810 [Scytolyngbya sp. HA4215-MV1]|nr:hypothetical protein [Scytolyngbya sp. HA4215-MV1]
MKTSNSQKWLKAIEFAVVGFATWLNPNAAFLIFLLKLCFQVLTILQERSRPKPDSKPALYTNLN